MIAGLAAMGTNQGVRALFIRLSKKFSLFHHWNLLQLSLRRKVFHTRECHDEAKNSEVLRDQGREG
jgi:hypothetical protein